MSLASLMLPRDVVLDALSAVTGQNVKSIKQFEKNNPGKPLPEKTTPQDMINLISLEFLTKLDVLFKAYGLDPAPFIKQLNEAFLIRKEVFIDEDDFFDPAYDYDFTHINDGDYQFRRGNEVYTRPCGWNRLALKVLDKYEDGNAWLGTGANAWPVSYHGTSIEGAKAIIKSHYKAGNRGIYGRGIYSTPDITVASIFSNTFTSKATKKMYNVVLQNRINPQKREIYHDGNYWLVRVPDGTSAADEKKIAESAIRPYGLLLKEVKSTADQDLTGSFMSLST